MLYDGDLHIQDPYFNCYFTDDAGNSLSLFRLFEMLSNFQTPRVIEGKPILRTVVSTCAERSWFANTLAEVKRWRPFPGKHIKFVGRFRTHYHSILNHDFTKSTMQMLESKGLPQDLSYLFLFPIAFTENSRYHEDYRRHRLLGEINIRALLARSTANDNMQKKSKTKISTLNSTAPTYPSSGACLTSISTLTD